MAQPVSCRTNDAFWMNDEHDGGNNCFQTIENNNVDLTIQYHHQQTISIGWRNLRYQSGKNVCCFGNHRKTILHRLNGHFRYHTLNALMGPSGAGKTTLLNCFTGNSHNGLTEETEIYWNKEQNDKLLSYFIEQHVHESIVGEMTVGDTLWYAYRFKNTNQTKQQTNRKMIKEFIQNIVKELMLDPLVLERNFSDCSGGEQKRIAVAQELMSLQKPSLLFVDEPTTGLDSNAALVVMNCLKQLTLNYRMTIIVTIHLPNNETLNLFDKLYVLAKGGLCIYSGPPSMLHSYLFEKINLNIEQIGQTNKLPIEILLEIACNGL